MSQFSATFNESYDEVGQQPQPKKSRAGWIIGGKRESEKPDLGGELAPERMERQGKPEPLGEDEDMMSLVDDTEMVLCHMCRKFFSVLDKNSVCINCAPTSSSSSSSSSSPSSSAPSQWTAVVEGGERGKMMNLATRSHRAASTRPDTTHHRSAPDPPSSSSSSSSTPLSESLTDSDPSSPSPSPSPSSSSPSSSSPKTCGKNSPILGMKSPRGKVVGRGRYQTSEGVGGVEEKRDNRRLVKQNSLQPQSFQNQQETVWKDTSSPSSSPPPPRPSSPALSVLSVAPTSSTSLFPPSSQMMNDESTEEEMSEEEEEDDDEGERPLGYQSIPERDVILRLVSETESMMKKIQSSHKKLNFFGEKSQQLFTPPTSASSLFPPPSTLPASSATTLNLFANPSLPCHLPSFLPPSSASSTALPPPSSPLLNTYSTRSRSRSRSRSRTRSGSPCPSIPSSNPAPHPSFPVLSTSPPPSPSSSPQPSDGEEDCPSPLPPPVPPVPPIPPIFSSEGERGGAVAGGWQRSRAETLVITYKEEKIILKISPNTIISEIIEDIKIQIGGEGELGKRGGGAKRVGGGGGGGGVVGGLFVGTSRGCKKVPEDEKIGELLAYLVDVFGFGKTEEGYPFLFKENTEEHPTLVLPHKMDDAAEKERERGNSARDKHVGKEDWQSISELYSAYCSLRFALDEGAKMMTRMEKDMVILNQLAASRQENEKPSAELLKKLGETHHSPTTVEHASDGGKTYRFEAKGEFGANKVIEVDTANQKVDIYDVKGQFHRTCMAPTLTALKRSAISPTKVKLYWEGNEVPERYSFLSKREREVFISSIMGAKRAPEYEDIRVAIVTWNVGNAPPPDSLYSAIAQGVDLCYVCLQECEYGGTNTNVEQDIFNSLHRQMGENSYFRAAALSLLYIRVIIFVKVQHRWKVTHVKTSKCATGIANLIGNKGGVGVSLDFNSTRLCFVGSHLAAHTERLPTRIENYIDISQKLKLKGDGELTSQHDHVFWCGDLNFRIDMDRDKALQLISKKQYGALIENDQLISVMKQGKCFHGFREGPIHFPPTYRYNRGDRTYSEEKMRVPSYCDRVLWRSLPGFLEDVKLEKYASCDEVMTSDHSPVLSVFRVRTRLPPSPQLQSKECCIVINTAGVLVSGLRITDKADLQLWGDWMDDTRQRITLPLTSLIHQRHSYQPDLPSFSPTDAQHVFMTSTTLSINSVLGFNSYLTTQHLNFAVRAEQQNKLKQTSMVTVAEGALSLQQVVCGDGPVVINDVDLCSRGIKEGSAFFKLSVIWTDKQQTQQNRNIKEGYLLKQGGARKNWKRRWFVLDKWCKLHYYESKEHREPLNMFSVKNTCINDKGSGPGRQNLIILETKKRTFYMCADSHDGKLEWLEALKAAGAKMRA